MRKMLSAGALAIVSVSLLACGDSTSTAVEATKVQLRSTSATPALVKSLIAGVDVYSLLSSDDVLAGSPTFRFGGSADGSGLIRNADGTFTALVNNEDNYSVSRITFYETLKPVKGDYVVNSTSGKYRMCSATMVTMEEHGFGPLFLTGGESNEESQVLAVNPFGTANTPKYVTGFGRWNTENTVPLPKTAYPGKTVILLGDDDSGAEGGQLAMYVAGTVGDLDGGKMYALARTDNNVRERDMVVGGSYPVEFREVTGHTAMTGRQINLATVALNAMQFGRVEDIDYRKDGVGREVYFNVTGQNTTGVNAAGGRTKYGRVYRVTLSATDPLKGTLEVLLDGDDRTGPAKTFQNPDNIYVGKDYVYIGEDDNGYGDESHDAYLYQYHIASKAIKPVLMLDHRRTNTDAAYFTPGTAQPFAGWEYGALIDISAQTGTENTFMLSVQPHTWRGDKYLAPDGGAVRPTENQASQVVIIRGLPR